MTRRRMKRGAAVLTLVCVAAMFFFPLMRGSYSAVHGPVTALQSAQAALHLRIAMADGALKVFGNYPVPLLHGEGLAAVIYAEFFPAGFSDFETILRC